MPIEPRGSGAPTVPAYPDVPVARRATWVSGVDIATGSASAVARMSALAGERGRPFDIVAFDMPARSWADIASPRIPALRQLPGRKVVTVPLVPAGASLTACQKGEYRTYWTRFARSLSTLSTPPIVSFDRFDPTSGGSGAAYADCFRHVAATVRSSAPRSRVQWNVLRGDNIAVEGRASSWPGRRHVDIVGIDAVDSGSDWTQTVNGPRGLTWWTDFAARQGRSVAIARWGHFPGSPTSAANAAYVQNMHDFIVRNVAKGRLAYEVYDPSARATGSAAKVYQELF